MSIRPIDIQTLLVQMSQVGKDQAAAKEGVALQASIQGAEEQKKRADAKEAIKGAEEGEAGFHGKFGQGHHPFKRRGRGNIRPGRPKNRAEIPAWCCGQRSRGCNYGEKTRESRFKMGPSDGRNRGFFPPVSARICLAQVGVGRRVVNNKSEPPQNGRD